MNNTTQGIISQGKYCIIKGLEFHIPEGAICPNCKQPIFEKRKRLVDNVESGFSVEDAASKHITGCPHCYYTFRKDNKNE